MDRYHDVMRTTITDAIINLVCTCTDPYHHRNFTKYITPDLKICISHDPHKVALPSEQPV